MCGKRKSKEAQNPKPCADITLNVLDGLRTYAVTVIMQADFKNNIKATSVTINSIQAQLPNITR